MRRIILFSFGILLQILGVAQPSVQILPAIPFITFQDSIQYLEFDFIIEGNGGKKYLLEKIEVMVKNERGLIQRRKKIIDEGMVSSFGIFPSTKVKGRKKISLFNPFYFWSHQIELSNLVYTFTFRKGKAYSQVIKEVEPVRYNQKTELQLPISGRIIIDSGYDHYAHHRRLNTTHWGMKLLKIDRNITRYALDLATINENNEIHENAGKELRDYYGFGENVHTTGPGIVVELAKGFPDNEIDEGPPYGFIKFLKNPKLASGNYVVIDHKNGEMSFFAHLKFESIQVEVGQKLETGDIIGQIGNSGDSIYPHLHYQLENEHTINVETYPPKFWGIQFLNGEKVDGPIYCNTGDLIE